MGGVKNASKTCSIVLKCGPKRTENEVHLGFRCNANTAQYHPGLVMLRSERCPWSSIKMAVTVTPLQVTPQTRMVQGAKLLVS